MATNALQNESAQAKPLTLWDAATEIEFAQGNADEMAKLIHLVSGNSEMVDEPVRQALRAIVTLAEAHSDELLKLADQLHEASRAQRGENVAEFPGRD